MLPRVGNLLPRPHDSSESNDYFFLGFLASTSISACVSLSSWFCNWIDHQVLDINLEIGNLKCMWRQTPLNLTKDSHTQHKEQPQNVARVFSFILKAKHKNPTRQTDLGWVGNSAKKIFCMTFDRLSLILDWSSQADLHSKSCSNSIPTLHKNTYFEQV